MSTVSYRLLKRKHTVGLIIPGWPQSQVLEFQFNDLKACTQYPWQLLILVAKNIQHACNNHLMNFWWSYFHQNENIGLCISAIVSFLWPNINDINDSLFELINLSYDQQVFCYFKSDDPIINSTEAYQMLWVPSAVVLKRVNVAWKQVTSPAWVEIELMLWSPSWFQSRCTNSYI